MSSDKCSYHKYKDLQVYCTKGQWNEMLVEAKRMVDEEGYDKEEALAELADNNCYGYNYGTRPSAYV